MCGISGIIDLDLRPIQGIERKLIAQSKLISHRGKFSANDSDIKTERDLEKKLFVNLLFDPGHDLEERIINEQFNNS